MRDVTIIGAKFARATRDGYLVVDAKLHQLGDQRPYFSVVGELWQSKGWYKNGQDGRLRECGMLHERILKAFPQLAPIIALHLADEDGVPMHAVENGRYWLERDPAAAARLWRVTVSDLPTPDRVEEFVEAQRPRWKAEAEAACKFLAESQ
jgi:hypothetical protein